MLSFTSVGQNPSDASQNIQTMRLRDDPPPITQPTRSSKKRKSPNNTDAQQASQQQQPTQQLTGQSQSIQVLPPPHALMHPMPGPLPPGYPYAPTDYTPGGIPQNPHPGMSLQPPQQSQQPNQSQQSSTSTRALSNSKRAEQNRKAQRAFRERRDQHVKALESRSSLLDAALASADEANRRWEECRALVDQLRVENAALRAALSQTHLIPSNLSNPTAAAVAAVATAAANVSPNFNLQHQHEEPKPADSATEPSKTES